MPNVLESFNRVLKLLFFFLQKFNLFIPTHLVCRCFTPLISKYLFVICYRSWFIPFVSRERERAMKSCLCEWNCSLFARFHSSFLFPIQILRECGELDLRARRRRCCPTTTLPLGKVNFNCISFKYQKANRTLPAWTISKQSSLHFLNEIVILRGVSRWTPRLPWHWVSVCVCVNAVPLMRRDEINKKKRWSKIIAIVLHKL